jgi:hypothetical protein
MRGVLLLGALLWLFCLPQLILAADKENIISQSVALPLFFLFSFQQDFSELTVVVLETD